MLIFKRPSEMEFRQIKRLVSKYDLNDNDKDLIQEQFTILKNNEKLLAFGRIIKGDNYSELDSIGVLETQRGKGWGGMIINKLLEIGPRTIWLTTEKPKYYEKHNFVIAKQPPKEISRRINPELLGRKTKVKAMVFNKAKEKKR